MVSSLVAQWLGFYTSTSWGTGSIPGQGIKIQQADSASCMTGPKKKKR